MYNKACLDKAGGKHIMSGIFFHLTPRTSAFIETHKWCGFGFERHIDGSTTTYLGKITVILSPENKTVEPSMFRRMGRYALVAMVAMAAVPALIPPPPDAPEDASPLGLYNSIIYSATGIAPFDDPMWRSKAHGQRWPGQFDMGPEAELFFN